MGILSEDNDCMLAKATLSWNSGRRMMLWKQQLLSSFQKKKITLASAEKKTFSYVFKRLSILLLILNLCQNK